MSYLASLTFLSVFFAFLAPAMESPSLSLLLAAPRKVFPRLQKTPLSLFNGQKEIPLVFSLLSLKHSLLYSFFFLFLSLFFSSLSLCSCPLSTPKSNQTKTSAPLKIFFFWICPSNHLCSWHTPLQRPATFLATCQPSIGILKASPDFAPASQEETRGEARLFHVAKWAAARMAPNGGSTHI